MDTNLKTLHFKIDEMCGSISEDSMSKVASKNWVLLLCRNVWIIGTDHNKTTKFSDDQLTEVWGNSIKQFLTSEKWIIVGRN